MLQLLNEQKIDLVNLFIKEFGTNPVLITPGIDIYVKVVNESYPRVEWITSLDTPFSTNSLFNPQFIVVNETICDELELTTRERLSMLAHEIGHILDSTPREGNEFQRELNADQIAVKLGLSMELASGLMKIVDWGKHKNKEEEIKFRLGLLLKEA